MSDAPSAEPLETQLFFWFFFGFFFGLEERFYGLPRSSMKRRSLAAETRKTLATRS
jgi:hypothetical protein